MAGDIINNTSLTSCFGQNESSLHLPLISDWLGWQSERKKKEKNIQTIYYDPKLPLNILVFRNYQNKVITIS